MTDIPGTNNGETIPGTAQSDRIFGLGGNDTLLGLAGNDILVGGDGNDILEGDDGDDTLIGDAGNDDMRGGKGNDIVSYFNSKTGAILWLDGSVSAKGSSIGDVFKDIENISGSNTAGDVLHGNAGANLIYGNGGNDLLYGKDGADTLLGGAGKDSLFGEEGDDNLTGGEGGDVLRGGKGTDTANYYFEAATTIAIDGSFRTAGAALGDALWQIENISGSNTGADKLAGDRSANTLYGNGGNDTLYGRAGNDMLLGGAGMDKLDGGTDNDTASYAFDTAVSASLDRSIVGKGAAAGDTFTSIENLSGSFTGNDKLAGDLANNTLYGFGGNDRLYGRKGNDNIVGGTGKDLLDGGEGYDQYYYFNPNEGGDTIVKFYEVDRIVVEGSAFGFGNYSGAMLDFAFTENSSNHARISENRFIFNTSDNTLWFDSDGTGAANPILLARFSQSLDLIKEFMAII